MIRVTMVVMAAVMLAGAVVAAACGGGSSASGAQSGPERIKVDGGAYMAVTPAQLSDMLAAKDFVMINVHVPPEKQIAGTDSTIPFNETEMLEGRLPDKAQKVLLYCQSGHMADIAARQLVRDGYTNVWALDGGLTAWQNAGYPVEPGP